MASRRLFILFIFVFSLTPLVAAQRDAQRFDEVAISPNGRRVAWIGPADSSSGESGERAILGIGLYTLDLENRGAPPVKINRGELANAPISGVAWSRDSERLVFLGAPTSGQAQVYVAAADGQVLRKLTSLTGDLANPAWSPDGKSIAFLFTENAPRTAGPLMPMTPETGVVEAKIYEQRLMTIDAAAGEVRAVTPPVMYVYEFDWSPDGWRFVLTAAPGAGVINWYLAQLYVVGAEGGAMRSIYKPPLQLAGPRWSPDGKNVAFIAGLMSDEGSTGGDIFVVPAAGGEARNVTPGIAASPSGLSWQSADKILFSERIDGDSGLASVELASGKVTQHCIPPTMTRKSAIRWW